MPEPWATRLVQEAGGELFLDEGELWPNGEFVTTHIIVRDRSSSKTTRTSSRAGARATSKTTQWINDEPRRGEDARQRADRGEYDDAARRQR